MSEQQQAQLQEKRRRINKGRLLDALRLKPKGPPSAELKEIYEQRKKDLALKERPELVPELQASDEILELIIQGRREQVELEARTSAVRQLKLPKRDRRNPLKDVELMPEKEIIVEN
jgi:hypothetical protein